MKDKNNLLLFIKNQFAQINQEPIIILGNQKSGTTVISKLIAIATNKTIHDDFLFRAYLTDFNYQKKTILGKLKIKSSNNKNNNYVDLLFNKNLSLQEFINLKKIYFSVDIIKEPDFTFFYKELLDIFPNAKFIFIVRNPFDNIRSILNRLNLEGNLTQEDPIYQQKLMNLKKTLPLWANILEGKNPTVNGNNYIENMAIRWNLAVETYLKNSHNILLIRYEDFLLDKVSCINNICSQLKLSVFTDVSSEVNKQYQPKGQSDINFSCFFEETNYKIIENCCQEKMKEIGYFNN